MMNWKLVLAATGIAFAWGCGNDVEDTDAPSTPDGQIKTVDGKADRWNYRNNPGHLRHELQTKFEDLPTEGYSAKVPWAGSYWPMLYDGINYRWQGSDILSPAEKYDAAFNDWQPAEDFMNHRPVDIHTCEFDQAYYDGLGPAADHTTKNNGNYRLVDGEDGDGDGVSDAEECQEHGPIKDWDGLEGWFGICHAWAPASLLEEEPMKAVERNGVKFEVSDIKALLMQQYDRTSAYSVGGRCYDEELEFDETGRVMNEECRDLNAGSWHVAVTNLLGENGAPLVIERTTNYEVWNQPMRGFEVTEQREITLEEALALLNLDTEGEEEPQGNGEFVHGVEEETAEAEAILRFVNSATFTELDDDARLYRTAASYITYYRPFNTLAELDDVPYVGSSAFNQLSTYVTDNDLIGSGSALYKYNQDAVKFVEIRMTTDWVTESHASVEPMTDSVDRYTRHDYYHYILELDADGHIIGGEWVGSSNRNHPDFIWRPIRAISGNPHISLDEVRDMIRESREDVVVDGGGSDALSFTNDTSVEIPDNDPTGATSTITVEEDGSVKVVKIDLDIDHTYRGDLLVELKLGPQVVTVYDGSSVDSPWEDDVNLDGVEVSGFEGSTVAGEWTLVVTDNAGYDVGNIVSWTLNVEVE